MKKFQNILAIESATSLCSVALLSGGKVNQLFTNVIGTHSSAIFMQTRQLLSGAGLEIHDLDAVLIGEGPGSFTGLRVAASAVKGLLFGQDVPLYAVNTLAGFAAGLDLPEDCTIHVIIDARRNHVYFQSFDIKMEAIPDRSDPFPVIGDLIHLASENEPVLIEIEHLYTHFKGGDVLIGTGISRLDADAIRALRVFNIDQTGARGMIRIYRAGLGAWFRLTDAAGFEPVYSVMER